MIPSTDQAKPDGEQGSDLGAGGLRGSLRANPRCESSTESLLTKAQGRQCGGGESDSLACVSRCQRLKGLGPGCQLLGRLTLWSRQLIFFLVHPNQYFLAYLKSQQRNAGIF